MNEREVERTESLKVYLEDLKQTKIDYRKKIERIDKEIKDAIVEMQEIIYF